MHPGRLIAVLTLLGGCSEGAQAPWDRTRQALIGGQIHGESLPPRTVVLTYDDGPDEHTLELARYLSQNGAPATFFVNGNRFCKTFDAAGTCLVRADTRPCNDGRAQAPVATPIFYPETLLDQLVALGHRIANHSQDHCHLAAQTNPDDLIWELQTTQSLLDRHIRDGVTLFRAPYGQWDQQVFDRLAPVMGLASLIGPVNWDVDGADWNCWPQGLSPQACADRYLAILEARPQQNGIILMHDRPEYNVGYDGPLQMAHILIPRLQLAGYRFATLDAVLQVGAADAAAEVAPFPPAADTAAGGGCALAGPGTRAPDRGVFGSVIGVLALLGLRRVAGPGKTVRDRRC